MTEYMRQEPPDGIPTQCDECGDWFDGNWMIEVRNNWVVCEDCVRDYQPCGHHKDSIKYASADAPDDTTHWCAECEGE